MKFLTIMFLLISVSCAHNTYLQNDQGGILKRCGKQELFVIAPDLPDAVHNGFLYWNDVLGQETFIYAGSLEPGESNVGLISVRADYFDSHNAPFGNDYCVKNNMKFLESGCLIGADIVIKNECLSNKPEVIETLVRRAVGNILGLASQVKPGTLMDFRMQLEAQHPLDACDESIEAVKSLYSN